MWCKVRKMSQLHEEYDGLPVKYSEDDSRHRELIISHGEWLIMSDSSGGVLSEDDLPILLDIPEGMLKPWEKRPKPVEEFRMPFGQYAGCLFEVIPKDYMMWAYNTWDDKKNVTKRVIEYVEKYY